MTKPVQELLPTNPCNGCGAPVAARRPSKTGAHWCPKPDCVRKKNRFYRKRLGDQEFATVSELCLAFFTAVANGQFQFCSMCGQERALNGWAHPRPDWSAPCKATGTRGDGLPFEWITALWPQR